MPSTDKLTLQDLLEMDGPQLHRIIERAYPLDLDALAEKQYQGVDLSLPTIVTKILWKTFRKTFHRDPASGVLRGWNVRMEQRGIDGERVPMKDKAGKPIAFGHYHVRSAAGLRFPRGWQGAHYLDYGVAGNKALDTPARLGYCPLVAVNEGSMDLLLGWEVFKLGSLFVPLPDYWALRLEGPLDEVVAVPRP